MVSQIQTNAAVHSSTRQTFSTSFFKSFESSSTLLVWLLGTSTGLISDSFTLVKCLTSLILWRAKQYKSSIRDQMLVTFRNYFILFIAKILECQFPANGPRKCQKATHTYPKWEKEASFEGDTANVISHVCVGHGFHECSVQSLFNWCVAFCELISTCKCIGVLRSHSCPHALSFPTRSKRVSVVSHQQSSAEQFNCLC